MGDPPDGVALPGGAWRRWCSVPMPWPPAGVGPPVPGHGSVQSLARQKCHRVTGSHSTSSPSVLASTAISGSCSVSRVASSGDSRARGSGCTREYPYPTRAIGKSRTRAILPMPSWRAVSRPAWILPLMEPLPAADRASETSARSSTDRRACRKARSNMRRSAAAASSTWGASMALVRSSAGSSPLVESTSDWASAIRSASPGYFTRSFSSRLMA